MGPHELGKSRAYTCPNFDTGIVVHYDHEMLLVSDGTAKLPYLVPFGLLIRVLEREPRLLHHMVQELSSAAPFPPKKD